MNLSSARISWSSGTTVAFHECRASLLLGMWIVQYKDKGNKGNQILINSQKDQVSSGGQDSLPPSGRLCRLYKKTMCGPPSPRPSGGGPAPPGGRRQAAQAEIRSLPGDSLPLSVQSVTIPCHCQKKFHSSFRGLWMKMNAVITLALLRKISLLSLDMLDFYMNKKHDWEKKISWS